MPLAAQGVGGMPYQEPGGGRQLGKKPEEGVSWPWQTTICLLGMAFGVSVGLGISSLRAAPVAPVQASLAEVSSKLKAGTKRIKRQPPLMSESAAHKERGHGRRLAAATSQAGGAGVSTGARHGALGVAPAAMVQEHSVAGNLSPPEVYDLLIVIPVAGQEVERRHAIRASWMKYLSSERCKPCSRHKVRAVFVAGTEGDVEATRAEAKEHGDLDILEDFGQQKYYTNRAEKTLRSIKHAVDHYNFSLLLKTDSDSWVYMDRLLQDLDGRQLWGKDKLYAGDFLDGQGATPSLDRESKWYDPFFTKITGLQEYPRHAKGAGYVLSRRLAEELAEQRPDFWQNMPSEDVSVGVWLFGLKHEKVPLNVFITPNCDGQGVIDHYITPEMMRERWALYEKTGSPCENRASFLQRSRRTSPSVLNVEGLLPSL